MVSVFLKLLNMSYAASWVILAVVVLRLALKKAPKWIRCALWALVAIRLVCPFSLPSPLSALSLTGVDVASDGQVAYFRYAGETEKPLVEFGTVMLSPADGAMDLAPHTSSAYLPPIIGIWLAGVAAMLLYAAVSFILMHRRVKPSLHLRDNIWLCDDIKTPFVLGIFRPCIYLPSGTEDAAAAHVLAHENAHLGRCDHLWKPLGWLLLAVHWFNPLVWLAYILLCRDIELACDEKVICSMEKSDMIAYSEALLSCSLPRRMAMACPLAFGEVGVKERIKTVLHYKKPALWVINVAVVACIVVALCFLTNPVKKPSDRSLKTEAWLLAQSCAFVNQVAIDKGTVVIVRASNGTWIDVYYPLIDSPGHIRVNFDMEDDMICSASTALESALPSLGDVITLSGKGEALTWSDFDAYAYTETGFGLYIRVYEIDERFSLRIGGGSIDEPPMYIRLVSEATPDAYIDIRTGDVEAFIAAHGGADGLAGIRQP